MRDPAAHEVRNKKNNLDSPVKPENDGEQLRNSNKLIELANKISTFPQLAKLLQQALVENPPVIIRDGGVIANGYDQELDELRNFLDSED